MIYWSCSSSQQEGRCGGVNLQFQLFWLGSSSVTQYLKGHCHGGFAFSFFGPNFTETDFFHEKSSTVHFLPWLQDDDMREFEELGYIFQNATISIFAITNRRQH